MKNFNVKEPWRIFRILAEFVEGFERMPDLEPAVAFFGSSKPLKEDSPYFILAKKIAYELAKNGFGIITGGGPGIMEAANKGAKEAKGKSCGLCIDIPLEEPPNAYIDKNFFFTFRYFFVRKVMFVKYAKAFVVLPGGLGTMDELFEALTLIHTKKIKRFPIFLVQKDYWKGLIDWIKETIIKQGNLVPEALNLLCITDSPEEIVQKMKEFWDQTQHLENF